MRAFPNGNALILHIEAVAGYDKGGGMQMYYDDRKQNPWEAKDPKPPVIQSGHLEKRRAY